MIEMFCTRQCSNTLPRSKRQSQSCRLLGNRLKRLLDEFEEIESLITRLKSEPEMPAKPPAYAIQLQGKLMGLGEKVLESLATDAVKQALPAAELALWAAYADQLIALAKAIGDWIASLPPCRDAPAPAGPLPPLRDSPVRSFGRGR